AGSQLGNVVAIEIRHPDVGSVERDAGRRPSRYREGPQQGAIAGSQLAYRGVTAIGYPDVRPIKSCRPGVCSHRQGAQHRAVLAPKLGYGVVAEIDRPHVGSVEGQCDRAVTCGEAGCDSWREAPRGLRRLVPLIPMLNGELVGILG